jgi:hypothetical protein
MLVEAKERSIFCGSEIMLIRNMRLQAHKPLTAAMALNSIAVIG